MRHGNKINHLGRTYSHRKSMLSNLASSLIANKRIVTTIAKAKELRRFVEPLVTKAKDNSTHSRRTVFSYLQDKVAVQELFDVVAGKVGDRPGGYLRIIRAGVRPGDNAEMAYIELVDFNEVYTGSKGAAAAGKTRRSRRGGAKKAEGTVAAAPKAAPVVDTAEEVAIEEEGIQEPVVEETSAQVEEAPVVEEAAEQEAPADEQAAAEETQEDEVDNNDTEKDTNEEQKA